MTKRRKTLGIVCIGAFATLTFAGAVIADGLRATRVADSREALLRPDATLWRKPAALKVAMLPQNIVPPKIDSPGVKEMFVRTLHNGEWIAFHIEWADATRSERIVADQFGDQVAIELPVKFNKEALPSPMMGNPGGRVTILQWRAAFQRDLEHGEVTVRDLYPNAQVDVYPDQVLRATDARPYTGALGLDNPISHPFLTPVLDQMAEGWGTMTVKPEQRADGHGAWKNGRWAVVILRPMNIEDAFTPPLTAGGETVAAFAVWDGGARDVGSRKAWSNWIPLRIE